MKYIKFTYVDALTGVSIVSEPAANGPAFPPVVGLEYAWARESQYPTAVPEFFGTCPGSSDTKIDGVLGVFSESDWENMRADEMLARRPVVPASCTPAQGLVALFAVKGITEDDVLAAIGQIADPVQQYTARIGLQRATSWERNSPTMQAMAALLGLTEQELDDLYTLAVTVVV